MAERQKNTNFGGDNIPVGGIHQYLRDINHLHHLPVEQQFALGEIASKGRAAQGQLNDTGKDLTDDERASMQKQIAWGREASQQLVETNLHLVITIARKYINRGLSLEDLVQEGNIGLMYAAENFDPKYERKFSDYASICIEGYILNALVEKGRYIQIPAEIDRRMKRFRHDLARLEQTLGRTPTRQEIATGLGISLEEVIENILLLSNPLSLEYPITAGSETVFGEKVADTTSVNWQTGIEESVTHRESLDTLLADLTEVERKVFSLCYGLTTGYRLTRKEVAKIENLEIKQVDAILVRAQRKIYRAAERLNSSDVF